ncbi:transglycosylase SLT domain-containing protein [Roseicella aerolata]|uniref:Transglycosylase SLT domain-containing protein n=1 Tax=Roseicella aerolata TaxID=2883479 RepID=A0A9X1L7X7_9PROT|nr:transglycosylase SLT domain-containing protein [Roseicella aerolata]MCB4822446.1 transglycosylase SLT domain-containing protein [Roseicella aerolata]
MRPDHGRAALTRRAENTCAHLPARLVPALAMAAALLAAPWLIPPAEAARGGPKPRAETSQPRKPAAQPRPAREARPAARQPTRATPARRASRPAAAARPARAALPARAAAPSGQSVTAAIDHASRATGLDPLLLVALAWQESRFDPRARNGRSTARGLMQFTEATWLEVVRDFGPRHGLAQRAAQLRTDAATGAITTRDPRHLKQILDLRDNPRLSAVLAAERINRARGGLQASLGRPVRAEDLYLVHLLGPAGAQRFLTALEKSPSRPAADFVSRDGHAMNRELFAERRSGRPLSLAELHGWVGRSIAGQRDLHGPMLVSLGVPPVLELADAR